MFELHSTPSCSPLAPVIIALSVNFQQSISAGGVTIAWRLGNNSNIKRGKCDQDLKTHVVLKSFIVCFCLSFAYSGACITEYMLEFFPLTILLEIILPMLVRAICWSH